VRLGESNPYLHGCLLPVVCNQYTFAAKCRGLVSPGVHEEAIVGRLCSKSDGP
jgi:hypothetical protein